MSKHTDGPWECGGYSVEAADGSLICNMSGWRNAGANKANERLIAAAPDLLAVLKELEECASYWSEYDVPLGIVERIRAAIKKAEAV